MHGPAWGNSAWGGPRKLEHEDTENDDRFLKRSIIYPLVVVVDRFENRSSFSPPSWAQVLDPNSPFEDDWKTLSIPDVQMLDAVRWPKIIFGDCTVTGQLLFVSFLHDFCLYELCIFGLNFFYKRFHNYQGSLANVLKWSDLKELKKTKFS